LFYCQILYANEGESINPVEKEKEEQQSPEVTSIGALRGCVDVFYWCLIVWYAFGFEIIFCILIFC
jgi:hypothetical protein